MAGGNEGNLVKLPGTEVLLFKTGDYGMIKDGCLIYQGRQDSQIKVRGHRVNMKEIENTISALTGVDMVVTLACHTKVGFR